MESEAPQPASARDARSLWSDLAQNPSLLPFVGELKSALQGCQTVLDVGCGSTSPMRYVPGFRLTGIDGHQPSLEQARSNRTHDEYVLGNVIRLGDSFPGRHFDACVGLDVIEHLPKEEGWRMLEQMERLATKRVVIATPNGFMPQKSKDGDLQEHLSGWTTVEMRERGYQVFGMYGPKYLRGEYHRIIRNPRAIWTLVSLFRHYASTRTQPEQSAALFCVKRLNGG